MSFDYSLYDKIEKGTGGSIIIIFCTKSILEINTINILEINTINILEINTINILEINTINIVLFG